MGLIKLLSPAYWYILAAKLGARLLLILAGIAVVAFLALQSGSVSVGVSSTVESMVRSFFGV